MKMKKGIQVMLLGGLLAVLYAVCCAQPQEEQEQEGVMAAAVAAISERVAANEALPEPSAVLTCMPQEVIARDGAFSYGNLEAALESGVAVQIDEVSETETVIELPGAFSEDMEAELPPRITLSYYRAEYGSERALICAILEQIPGAETLRRCYRNENKRRYSYNFTDGCFKYHVLVNGEELYLLGEIEMEEDYSVSHLLDMSAFTWEDSGEAAGCSGKWTEKYSMLDEREVRFLAENYNSSSAYKEETNFYLRGCYEEPYQTLPLCFYEGAFLDLNFDGYTDLSMTGDDGAERYLWDCEERVFVPAYLNIGEYILYSWSSAMYDETQTILLHRGLYTENGTWYGEAECICKWEGDELVILRECLWEEDEESLRVYAYEEDTGSVLFDETFDRELWEEDESVGRPLYEQFFDGLVPAEAWGKNHSLEEEPGETYIPQELLDILADSFINDTALEVIGPMVDDDVVEWEELVDIAKENLQMRLELESDYTYRPSYLALRADLDNDGIGDLYVEISDGGSAGGTEAAFFKGQEDGTYVRTCRSGHIREEVAVISYEGENYLCRTTYDYGLKQVNGLDLFCYEDGVCVEEVSLRLTPADCGAQVIACSDSAYREAAEAVAAESGTLRERISKYEVIVGTAEQELETDTEYLCDLDNDGSEESYQKYIWFCSNYHTTNMLILRVDAWETNYVAEAISDEGKTPMMLCVESVNGENIINVLYVTGFWDYEIVGYVFHGADYKEVYRIKSNVQYEIEQTRTAAGEPDNSDPYPG